jgi:hypothetical protein
MLIIFVLTEEGNGVLGLVGILLRHVEIVDKLKQLIFTEWSICLTGLLFELTFELALKKS